MSEPRAYQATTASGLAIPASPGVLVSWTKLFDKSGGGQPQHNYIASQYSMDASVFYVKNTGANSLDAQVYGLMATTDAVDLATVIANGVPLLASATTIAASTQGAVTLTGGAEAWVYYALVLVSASGTTATVKALVKGQT